MTPGASREALRPSMCQDVRTRSDCGHVGVCAAGSARAGAAHTPTLALIGTIGPRPTRHVRMHPRLGWWDDPRVTVGSVWSAPASVSFADRIPGGSLIDTLDVREERGLCRSDGR